MLEEELSKKSNILSEFNEYWKEIKLRSNKDKLREFSELRNFNLKTIEESDIVYIENSVELMIPKYIDSLLDFGIISTNNNKPIFHNRWIIPIKDEKNNIINLVGYQNNSHERYIYGTGKYYLRRDTLYGLENLNLAYRLGYAFVTEGITDTIRLRELGYKNSFAMCGTHNSKFIWNQLNRCRHGIIKIPDRDAAGQKAVKNWKCNRSIELQVGIKYKDLDELASDGDNVEWAKAYLDGCINWILKDEHRGYESIQEKVTML